MWRKTPDLARWAPLHAFLLIALLAAAATVAAAEPAKPAAKAAAPAPTPEEAELRAAATRLDTEVRRWLSRGPEREDGYVYAMDLAPVMLYAAQRGDAELYGKAYKAALPLIVDGKDPGTQGFVLWRHKNGAAPEVTGSTEALWMARALWAGQQKLKRAADRALAVHIVNGYARHARGDENSWRVSKYYAFGTKSYASLSLLPNYNPDFLQEAEPVAGAPAKGLAKRSYALLNRAVTPSRLMVPLIQPAVGEVLPGLGFVSYAPNGIVSLEDSCAAAEGALRGSPQLAANVLAFAAAKERRDDTGRLFAYYHRQDGRVVGTQVLSTNGIACLGRIAVARNDRASIGALRMSLTGDMRALVEKEQVAPLHGAGPLLLTAKALGAL